MDHTNLELINICFAKNPLGNFLSNSYPIPTSEADILSQSQKYILYVELGIDKWHVHAVSEFDNKLNTEFLALVGQVVVTSEAQLLQWFPQFSDWLNCTLPFDFDCSACSESSDF